MVQTLEASPYSTPLAQRTRLVLVAEPLDGDDRAEDLVLDHLVVLVQAGDDGRGVQVAALPHPVAARDQLGMGGPALDEALDPRQLVRVVQRAEVRVGHVQAAGGRVAGLLAERRGQVRGDAGAGQHAGRRGAVLPGVEVAGAGDPLGRGLHVGVVEDHDRGLAAKLEVHALEVVGGGARDLHAGPDRAGDRDHAGGLMRDQLAAGVAVAADHVEHARRQELGGDLGQQQGGRRGGVRRLEHHGVARGDRRRELPDRHHHRVVPGRHLGADADRLAPDHRGVVLHVLARAAALEHPGGAGEEPDLVHRGRDLLGPGQRDRLAGVAGLGLDELVGPLLDRVGEPEQGQAALGRGGVPPALERVGRGLHGGVHVLAAGYRRVRVNLAGTRIDHIAGAPIAGVGELAVDEVLQRAVCHLEPSIRRHVFACGMYGSPRSQGRASQRRTISTSESVAIFIYTDEISWPIGRHDAAWDTVSGGGGDRMAHSPRTLLAQGPSGLVPDDIAKQIIEQLQEDGRRSYAAIGKAVGLSEAAVRQRVQRLQDSGVMQIVAVTDPLTLGFRRQAMVAIKTDGDLEKVADELAEMDEVDYVVITAGSFDLLAEVVCEDDDHLLEILSRVRAVPCVTSTETFVYLKLRKQTYSWGTR